MSTGGPRAGTRNMRKWDALGIAHDIRLLCGIFGDRLALGLFSVLEQERLDASNRPHQTSATPDGLQHASLSATPDTQSLRLAAEVVCRLTGGKVLTHFHFERNDLNLALGIATGRCRDDLRCSTMVENGCRRRHKLGRRHTVHVTRTHIATGHATAAAQILGLRALKRHRGQKALIGAARAEGLDFRRHD
jgi:hypothetical protein